MHEELDTWARMVERVAAGYDGGIGNYSHDLEVRDAIQAWIDALTLGSRATAEEQLHPIDEAFLAATFETNHDIEEPARHIKRPSVWWWRRRAPILHTEDFAEGLRGLDLIG